MTDKQKELINEMTELSQECGLYDKQIIIDGVDVSGCNFLLKREDKILCECCHATGFGVICECEKWETCDHKQLKSKEQECESLKETLEEIRRIANSSSKSDLRALRTFGEIIFATTSEVLDG